MTDSRLAVDLVFHDADRKFGKAFGGALRERGARPRRLRPRSPNLNAFVERWIQSIQIECLNHFVVLGASHLDHLVQQFVTHYHEELPHQGLNNQLIIAGQPPPNDDVPMLHDIACHERLGGLLRQSSPPSCRTVVDPTAWPTLSRKSAVPSGRERETTRPPRTWSWWRSTGRNCPPPSRAFLILADAS